MLQELRRAAERDPDAEVEPVFPRGGDRGELKRFRAIVESYTAPRPPFWSRQELAVAAIICLLVFGSTFPLVVPFMVIGGVRLPFGRGSSRWSVRCSP